VSAPIQNILAVAGRVRMRSAYLQMLDLLAGLDARGRSVSVVCATLPAETLMREISFPVTTWSAVGSGRSGIFRPVTFQDFYDRLKPQVIHVHGTGLRHSGRRFLNSISAPVVFTPYVTATETREIRRIQRRAARVIALNEHMREALVNHVGIPRERLRVVPPGVDVNQYDLLLPGIGEREAVIGAAAPLEPGRGQSTFLQAARLLLNSGREAQFIIGGDGPAERALRREAAKLGVEKRVTFVTRLSNYRSVISAMDVRPAPAGNLSYAALQAMAMGKAVVATIAGDVPELLEEGRTGLMVPKDDPPALAHVLMQLLDRPEAAREMGLAARRAVSERFNMDLLVENTLRVYEEAVLETGD